MGFLILLFFGVVLLAVGAVVFLLISKSSQVKRDGVRVTGVISGYEERENREGTTVDFHPIVKFQTDDGSTREVSLAIGYKNKPYTVGSSLQVIYDPKNPSLVILA